MEFVCVVVSLGPLGNLFWESTLLQSLKQPRKNSVDKPRSKEQHKNYLKAQFLDMQSQNLDKVSFLVTNIFLFYMHSFEKSKQYLGNPLIYFGIISNHCSNFKPNWDIQNTTMKPYNRHKAFCVCVHVSRISYPLPPLGSETGWTGDFWVKIVFLK